MSTATTAPAAAGTAAAPAVVAPMAEKKPITPSIAAQIRRRAQGLPELTPDQIAAAQKAKDDAKAAADKKLADEKAAADEAAKAAGTAPAVVAPVVDKVAKKPKAGPTLPDPKPVAEPSIADQVRDALAKDKQTQTAATPELSPEVQREVDLAAFAAKKNPDRYAGMAEKVVGFYQSRDQMLAGKAKELGGQQSGEFKDYLESDEFKEWVRQNRPVYQRGDVARLQEDMIADRAKAEARAELAPELKALERRTAELQHAPEINALTNQALKIIITDPNAEKDPALEGFAKDPMKFGEDFPDEARIIAREAAEAVEQIREVYRIDRDLVDFNRAKPTALQVQVRNFAVERNAELRANHPNGFETRDGKILIDADTYEKHGLAKDPRYRTFTAHEIAVMIAANRNAEVLAKLKQRREGVAKSVYAPKPAVVVAAPVVQEPVKVEAAPSPDAVTTRVTGTRGGKPLTTAWKTAKDRYLNGK